MNGTVVPHRRRLAIAAGALFLMAALVPPTPAQRERQHSTQITHAFVNNTGVPAHGLVVKLSHRSVVSLSEDNQAGPFRNFNGNDSTRVYLSNPDAPIDVADEVEVIFRSFSNSARIKAFWWTDERGKRIGRKRKL